MHSAAGPQHSLVTPVRVPSRHCLLAPNAADDAPWVQAPYTDQGWVDEEADPFKWAKNLFGGKKKEEAKEEKK